MNTVEEMNRGKPIPTLLLNSSHGRYVLGSDPWVRATLDALDKLDPVVHEIITSVGLANWELTACAAAAKGLRQRLVLPGRDNSAGHRYFARCLDEFGLDGKLTAPVFAGERDGRRFLTLRDQLAFETARVVYPVSVRPSGRLDKLLDQFTASGGETNEKFRVQYDSGGWRPRYNLKAHALDPALEEFSSRWLIHWTHSSPGPWSTETPAEFYRDLMRNPGGYVRSAAATLARIVSENVLRSSGFHMSGGEMMVSLSALPPAEALPLMRWRSRWRRWSMEPYGIAFRKEALVRLGARQVAYYDKLPERITAAEKKFSQRRGRITDWSGEQEWRVSGDIRLDAVPPSDKALLVYDNNWRTDYPKPALEYRIVPLFSMK